MAQDTAEISCPYCGSGLTVAIDYSMTVQSYVEDCQVCCRPMMIRVEQDSAGELVVSAEPENA